MESKVFGFAKGYVAAVAAAVMTFYLQSSRIQDTFNQASKLWFGTLTSDLDSLIIYGVAIFFFALPLWILIAVIGARYVTRMVIYYAISGAISGVILGPLGSALTTPMFFDMNNSPIGYERAIVTLSNSWTTFILMGSVAGVAYWLVADSKSS